MNRSVPDHAGLPGRRVGRCALLPVRLACALGRRLLLRSVFLLLFFPLTLLVVLFFLGQPPPSAAQQAEVIDREPEIKAAYLYNFGRYVEWPAETKTAGGGGPAGEGEPPEFVIGVAGESSITTPLRTIAASKKVAGRTIAVREIKSEADYRSCQLLFVPSGQNAELVADILRKARQTATLVVGDDEGFAQRQGHIGFYIDQNNVKFEINSAAAEKTGLKISSKLLRLGRIVGEKQGN